MTIREAMARADEMRPNTISEEQKARWLMDLDGQLGQRLGVRGKEREGRELLFPAPYEEVYQLYLVTKIDYYNQDMTLYANDAEVYDTALKEALAWWRRTHRPKRSGNWKVM